NATLTGTSYGTDKGGSGSYVVAISHAPGDENVLWAATRFGRLFITTNVDAPAANVTFTRIDTSAQPNRFISAIAVDPTNPYHAAPGLPMAAVYSLTISVSGRTLYAATHGRGAWRLDLGK